MPKDMLSENVKVKKQQNWLKDQGLPLTGD